MGQSAGERSKNSSGGVCGWIDLIENVPLRVHSSFPLSTVCVGVGAAFNILSGRVTDAPQWIKHAALQWLHRMVQEPRRPVRRYAVNNSFSLCHIALQLIGIRGYDPQTPLYASNCVTSSGIESRSCQ